MKSLRIIAGLSTLVLLSTALSPALAGNLVQVGTDASLVGQKAQADLETTRLQAAVVAPGNGMNLNATELAILGEHEVMLIVDKSRSMLKADCVDKAVQKHVSRWDWCRQQAINLTSQTMSTLPEGIKVVLFSDDFVVHSDVRPHSLDEIFADTTPTGGTDTAAALKSQLDEYFATRAQEANAKPLLVAVVTDGCPDSPIRLRQAIVDATQKMNSGDQVSVTFLQIGKDANGTRFLNDLDRKLVAENAKYDIVSVKSFAELSAKGLARALVEGLTSKALTAHSAQPSAADAL